MALAGICTVTENVQLPKGAIVPAEKVSTEEPDRLELAPHGLAGRPLAVAPDSIAPRSSVNARSLMGSVVDGFVMVKLSWAVPVAVVGPSKDLENVGAAASNTVRSSVATFPVTIATPATAVTVDVVFV